MVGGTVCGGVRCGVGSPATTTSVVEAAWPWAPKAVSVNVYRSAVCDVSAGNSSVLDTVRPAQAKRPSIPEPVSSHIIALATLALNVTRPPLLPSLAGLAVNPATAGFFGCDLDAADADGVTSIPAATTAPTTVLTLIVDLFPRQDRTW